MSPAAVIEAGDLEFGWAPDQPLLRIERLTVDAMSGRIVSDKKGDG